MNDGERHSPVFDPESINHYRHMTAYHFALARVAHQDVLEYGCGSGYGANFLLRRGQPRRFIGVDVDESAIAYCQRSYPDLRDRFEAIAPGRIPFENQSFDLVLLFQVLEHVPGDGALLEDIGRALRPGGSLLLTTPNVEASGGDPDHPSNSFHIREYTKARLRGLCARYFDAIEELGVQGSLRVAGRGLGMERSRLSRASRKLHRWLFPPVYTPPVSLGDFTVRRTDVRRSLDLLFVCTKR